MRQFSSANASSSDQSQLVEEGIHSTVSIHRVKDIAFFTDALVRSLTSLLGLGLSKWLKVQQIFFNYHSMK